MELAYTSPDEDLALLLFAAALVGVGGWLLVHRARVSANLIESSDDEWLGPRERAMPILVTVGGAVLCVVGLALIGLAILRIAR